MIFRVHCTLQTSKENALPEPSSGHRAGENITRDSQCRLHFRDPSSYFCEVGLKPEHIFHK